MTATEIRQSIQPLNSNIQLRDIWFLMRQFQARGMAVCLTPGHLNGKLYALTDFGRKVAKRVLEVDHRPHPAEGIDWRQYGLIARAKLRKLVLLELQRPAPIASKTVPALRKRLSEKYPVGLNPTIRALKELEQFALAQSEVLSLRSGQKAYRLTEMGDQIASQFLR